MSAEATSAGPILGLVIALLIGLVVRSAGSLMPQRLEVIPLPYTALILLLGIAVGAIVQNCSPVEYATASLESLESISPNALFTIFLPALIMPSGLHLQWHVVKRVLDKALLLAIPGTLVNAGATALVARYVFPYDWPWSACWLFGGTLAATDPVATVAIIKTLGISPKLATIIDGEALLNDGVAFVMFVIFERWASGENLTAGSVIEFVAKSSIAGPLVALGWAAAMILWLTSSYNDGIFEVSLSVVAVYSLWIVTDSMMKASGLLAVVVFATALGAYGKARVSRSQAHVFEFFWDWVDWTANTLIFFLSGLITAVELSKLNSVKAADWGWAVVLWLMLLVIRILMTVFFYPLLTLGSYGIDWRDAIIVAWAGLRGAVGLTLALIVYYSDSLQDIPYREHFLFFTAFVAFVTLLVQGSTTSLLLKALGYTELPESKRASMIGAAKAVEKMGRVKVQKAKKASHLLGDADWEKVSAMTDIGVVGDVRKRPAGKLKSRLAKLNTSRYIREGTEAVVDLRERLLQVLLALGNDAFSKGYLSPEEFEILEEVVEKSLEDTHKGLTDWEKLDKALAPIESLISEPPLWKRIIKFWQWRDGQVKRDAALCAVYAYAHAEARRDLEIFMHVQFLHVDDSDTASVSSIGSGFARTNSGTPGWKGTSPRGGKSMGLTGMPGLAGVGQGDDLRAHWLDSKVENTRNIVQEAIIDSKPSDLEDMPNLYRISAMEQEAVQHELDIVLDESRAAQAKAEERLAALRDICPEPVKDLRTKQVAMDILKQEQDFLGRFEEAGLLEGCEVGPAIAKIQRRLQWLELAGFWGFLPGMRKLQEKTI